jgi:hypothetical protein
LFFVFVVVVVFFFASLAGMSDADPAAVWVLQGWFLLDSWWQPPQTKESTRTKQDIL